MIDYVYYSKRKFLRASVALFFFFLFYSQTSFARDMQGRFGLGYNSQFGTSYAGGPVLSGISFKYGLTRDFAVEGIFGIATSTPSQSATALKIFKNLFYETHLNFYFLVGGGYISGNANSGIQAIGGFGAEFFIPGLESLGFAFEAGVSFDNGTGNYAVRTLGVSFLDAGIHFYF